MKIKVGDRVDYHSVIGREITSTGHTVIGVYPKPNNFGFDCATISGKAGVVAIAALTPSPANAGAVPRRGSDVGTSPLLGLPGSGD